MLNPVTILHLGEGAGDELEVVQVRGIHHMVCRTEAHVGSRDRLGMNERLFTHEFHESQQVTSKVIVHLESTASNGEVLSHSVARDRLIQIFQVNRIEETQCKGHVACDSIISVIAGLAGCRRFGLKPDIPNRRSYSAAMPFLTGTFVPWSGFIPYGPLDDDPLYRLNRPA